MKTQKSMALACAIAAVMAGSSALAVEAPVPPVIEAGVPLEPVRPQTHTKPVAHVVAAQPAVELPTTATATVGFGARSSFTSSSVPVEDATTLSPPASSPY